MNPVHSIPFTVADAFERPVAVPIRFTTRRRHIHAAGHDLIRLREQHRRPLAVTCHANRPHALGFPR